MVGGFPYPQVPSRFLREIPDRLLEKVGGPAFRSGRQGRTGSVGFTTSPAAVRSTRGIVRRSGFEVGDRVRHPDWGLGRVLTISGQGGRASATVFFPDLKERRELMLSAVERVQGFGP